MLQPKVSTSVSQTVCFVNDKPTKKIRESEARFQNGVFSSLTFYVNDETHRFYSIESLKEVQELLEQVIEFSETNQKEVEEKVRKNSDRLLRPDSMTK